MVSKALLAVANHPILELQLFLFFFPRLSRVNHLIEWCFVASSSIASATQHEIQTTSVHFVTETADIIQKQRSRLRTGDHWRPCRHEEGRWCVFSFSNRSKALYREYHIASLKSDLHLCTISWLRGVGVNITVLFSKWLWFDSCRRTKFLARCRLGCRFVD